MDIQVTYADLNFPRESALGSPSPPLLPQNICLGPRWHPCALKLGCAGIFLLALTVIGLSVSVIFLSQKPMEKSNVEAEEFKNETAERPRPLACPIDWHPLQEKCLFFSDTFKPWTNSSSDCYTKKSSLLLIQDQKELRLIQRLISTGGILFWIGLNFSLSERNWKWINGSFFNSDILQIIGDAKENSCVYISNTNIFSDTCDIENKWICQKEQKPVTNKVCPDT